MSERLVLVRNGVAEEEGIPILGDPFSPAGGAELLARVREVLARSRRPPLVRKYVCETCRDTHVMTLHREGDPSKDREVMCTRCPVPCQRCRAGGNGPYCAKTRCACACHGARGTR